MLKALRDLFEPGGDGVEGLGHAIRRGRRIGGRRSAVQTRLVKFVGQQQAGHQEQADVADMADLARNLADMAVELFGEQANAVFLAIGAADGVGTAVDLDGHRRHQRASVSGRLALLERRLLDLKSRAAGPVRAPDDDLFAPQPSSETDRARIHELEAAGRDAAQVLARAAEAIRASLPETEAR